MKKLVKANYKATVLDYTNKKAEQFHWQCPDCQKYTATGFTKMGRDLFNKINQGKKIPLNCPDCFSRYLVKHYTPLEILAERFRNEELS